MIIALQDYKLCVMSYIGFEWSPETTFKKTKFSISIDLKSEAFIFKTKFLQKNSVFLHTEILKSKSYFYSRLVVKTVFLFVIKSPPCENRRVNILILLAFNPSHRLYVFKLAFAQLHFTLLRFCSKQFFNLIVVNFWWLPNVSQKSQ